MRINTDKNCNIIIFDDTEYPVNGIEYNKSVSLYIVQLNESNKTTILYDKIDTHKGNNGQPIVLSPLKGGYVTVCHIIVPTTRRDDSPVDDKPSDEYVRTIDYIRNAQIDILLGINTGGTLGSSPIIQNPTTSNNNYNYNNTNVPLYYFSDGVNFYKEDLQGNVTKVTEQELVEVNPDSTNIYIQMQNFFSVCYLRKCYVSLCQKIFDERAFDRCFNNKVNSQLIYKRDLVWAALNVIQYMIDSNQIAEAQRLLERINGCNGLCSKEDTGEKGCGCE